MPPLKRPRKDDQLSKILNLGKKSWASQRAIANISFSLRQPRAHPERTQVPRGLSSRRESGRVRCAGRARSAPADLTRPFGTVTLQTHGPGRRSIAPDAINVADWGRAGGWWKPSAWRWTAPQTQASRSRTRSRCCSPPLSRACTTPTSSSRRTMHAHATVGIHGQSCCIHWPGSAVRPRVAVASNARPTRD